MFARQAAARDIVLYNQKELNAFRRDPDGFVAAHFGLTTPEYREWVKLDGLPLCGALTRKGRACKKGIGRIQREAGEWKAMHRQAVCDVHREAQEQDAYEAAFLAERFDSSLHKD